VLDYNPLADYILKMYFVDDCLLEPFLDELDLKLVTVESCPVNVESLVPIHTVEHQILLILRP
jgi:hypothetical protein